MNIILYDKMLRIASRFGFYLSSLRPLMRTVATSAPEGKIIDFGFQQVPRDEKATLVKELFNRAAKHYDVLNDVVSLGVQRSWKRELARKLGTSGILPCIGSLEPRQVFDPVTKTLKMKKINIIDVCGGTGDISFQILELAKKTRYYQNSTC